VTSTEEGRTRIGVISDTHGHLDPVVLELFAGVDHIIHAGDVMDGETLQALEGVAPVTVVPGNLDTGKLARQPREVTGTAGSVLFAVGHKRKRLLKKLATGKIDGLPAGRQPDLVVFGHDHLPAAEWVDGMLYLNPGTAASPHEEDDDPTIAIVSVEPTGLSVTFIPLLRSEEALTG
jgi:putative phosphoesterase